MDLFDAGVIALFVALVAFAGYCNREYWKERRLLSQEEKDADDEYMQMEGRTW